MMIKYRLREAAKDFEKTPKELSEILSTYLQAPKSNMQVLTERELDVIFEFLTQHNQVENLEEVMRTSVYHTPKPSPAEQAPAQTPAPEAAAAVAASPPSQPAPAAVAHAATPHQQPRPGGFAPAAGAAHQPAAAQPQPRPQQQHTGPRRTYVDTRGSSSVNLARYDERIDTLVPDSASKLSQGKEKIVKRVTDRKPMISQKKRLEEQEKMRRLQMETRKKIQLKVLIPDEINVGELAVRLKKSAADVIRRLVKLGVMASVSQMIDYDTAALVAMEFGARVEHEVIRTIEDRLIDDRADEAGDLFPRDPVVVVMGHVDHGKTSLLDSIRNTSVASGEAGGITQHIGAYRVEKNGHKITFLDTPGHAAFTSMRARGARATDIAILVVAADDGIMPQTIEAINHAKAAKVPIIVAINKMDKEGANPERITQQLTEYDLVPEEWGGDTILCKISATKNEGIDRLLEMILLTAEMLDLKANPSRPAKGTVIEAKLDRGRGPVSTLLIQNGTLKNGDIVIAGMAVGHVRAMTNDRGDRIEEAGPSTPVEVIGLSEVPGAGDLFYVVADERMARELVDQRKVKEKEQRYGAAEKVTLENLFTHIQQGNIKDLNIIVKADVQGSAEAVRTSLGKLSNEEVRLNVIHCAVGTVNESDVMLASASNAIIVGFNVRPDAATLENAKMKDVDIRLYRIIYDCIEEMESAIKGMLTPKYKETVQGHAEIRQTFKVSGIGTIAGCYVLDGKITRASGVRIVRGGVVVHEGILASLKRFKDDVKEAAAGYECGLGIERFNDIKEGDIVEAFIMEEIKN